MKSFIVLVALCVCLGRESFGQDQVVTAAGQVASIQAASDNFHRSVIKAASKAVRDGKLKRVDLVRLRVAMLSPAFRERALDLAVIQMSASGADGLELDENGLIDRASIDWEAFAAFLEKLLPLILQLIQAFGTLESFDVYVDANGQPCGAEIVCGGLVFSV